MQKKQKEQAKAKPKASPYCPHCEESWVSDRGIDLKYCPECGAELIQENQCVFCRTPLQPESKYCPTCGQIAIH